MKVVLRVNPKTGMVTAFFWPGPGEPPPVVDSAPDKPVNGGVPEPEKEPEKPKPS